MTRSTVQPGREEDRIIPLVNQPVPSPVTATVPRKMPENHRNGTVPTYRRMPG